MKIQRETSYPSIERLSTRGVTFTLLFKSNYFCDPQNMALIPRRQCSGTAKSTPGTKKPTTYKQNVLLLKSKPKATGPARKP